MIQVRQLGAGPQGIIRDLEKLNRKSVPRATARALNRQNARIKTIAARAIAARFKLSARKSKATIAQPKWRRATPTRLMASGGVRVIIKEIDAGHGVGTRVTVHKNKKVQIWTGAFPIFKTQLKSGHTGFFMRTPESKQSTGRDKDGRKRLNRLPIREAYIDATSASFRLVMKEVERASREWDKRFSNELKFELSKVT